MLRVVGLVIEQAVDDIGELTGRRNGAGSKASVAPPLCVWACRRCTAAGLVCRKPSAIARCRGNNRLVHGLVLRILEDLPGRAAGEVTHTRAV